MKQLLAQKIHLKLKEELAANKKIEASVDEFQMLQITQEIEDNQLKSNLSALFV